MEVYFKRNDLGSERRTVLQTASKKAKGQIFIIWKVMKQATRAQLCAPGMEIHHVYLVYRL